MQSNTTTKKSKYLAFKLCVATLFVFVSASCNATFGWQFGIIFAVACIGFDLFKPICVLAAKEYIAEKNYILAAISSTMATALVGVSIYSATGYYSDSKNAVSDKAGAQIQAYETAKKTYDLATANLDAMGPIAPFSQAQANALKPTRRYWIKSKKCTDANWRTRCARYNASRDKLARAIAAKKLVTKRDAAAAIMRANPLLESKDPQNAMLAGIFNVSEQRVKYYATLFVALVIEAGATFGYLIAKGSQATPAFPMRSKNEHMAPIPRLAFPMPIRPKQKALPLPESEMLPYMMQRSNGSGEFLSPYRKLGEDIGRSGGTAHQFVQRLEASGDVRTERDGNQTRFIILAKRNAF